MNRELVGRSYPPTSYTVTTEASERYAHAINEDNPRFFGEQGHERVAPPLFSVVYHPKALGQAIGDRELGIDFKRALHGEQDMRFHAPIRPGDEISTAARIVAIEDRGSGETIAIELVSHNQHGDPIETTLFTLFVRGASRREARDEPVEGAASRGEPVAQVTQHLDDDQTYRYAEASGDRTKIHLDAEAARRAGLPGIIGHGLCTMAFVSKALVDELAGGDPTGLARMALRFARPVIPGQPIETRVWAGSRPDEFAFETVDREGRPVVSQGLAEIRAAAR
ncbi:MAG: dehydratase [Deltaproteobacteria bacterium]|jgi:acyl dehydratase|nr:dehydratase [Deltaproteobacteria bacterium]